MRRSGLKEGGTGEWLYELCMACNAKLWGFGRIEEPTKHVGQDFPKDDDDGVRRPGSMGVSRAWARASRVYSEVCCRPDSAEHPSWASQLKVPVSSLSLTLINFFSFLFSFPFFPWPMWYIYIYYNPGGDVICKGCGVANDGHFTYCQKKKDRLSNW